MSTEFIWPVRVYYEDTDAGGVVYYANYLKFFERGRSEWLNDLGVDQAALLKENVVFVVKKVEIDFAKPAKFNDELEVVSVIKKVRGVSVFFEQRIYKRGDRNQLLCQGEIKIACLNLESFTPCRIPTVVMKELQSVS